MSNYDPKLHHRRSIRLKSWDYNSAGAYFITTIAHDRQTLFGEVSNSEVVLSAYGEVVRQEWLASANIRHEIELDEFIIMPDHFHAIVLIDNTAVSTTQARVQGSSSSGSSATSLGRLMAGFKSAAATRINKMRGTPGVSVWQRDYYERIIRSERELRAIREYIQANPANWLGQGDDVHRFMNELDQLG